MDAAKDIVNVVDGLGHAMIAFDIHIGMRKSLMASLCGIEINLLWLADNSIPLHEDFRLEADHFLISLREFRDDSLLLSARRLYQLYGSILIESNYGSPGNLLFQPLLCRPMLDTLVLLVAIFKTSDVADRSAGIYFDQADTCHNEEEFYAFRDDSSLFSDSPVDVKTKRTGRQLNFMPACDNVTFRKEDFRQYLTAVILARLVQLILIKVSVMNDREHPAEDERFRPLHDLPISAFIREVYKKINNFVHGNEAAKCIGIPSLHDSLIFDIIIGWISFIRDCIHLLSRCKVIDSDPSSISDCNSPSAMEISRIIQEHFKVLDIKNLCECFELDSEFDSLLELSTWWLREYFGVEAKNVTSSEICSYYSSTKHSSSLGSSLLIRDLFGSDGDIRRAFLSDSFVAYRCDVWKEYDAILPSDEVEVFVPRNLSLLRARLGILDVRLKSSKLRGDISARNWLLPLKKLIIACLPDSYTKFHQQVSALCKFEYPAVCFHCGLLVNAGNGLIDKILGL
jgi:hypothetical protein